MRWPRPDALASNAVPTPSELRKALDAFGAFVQVVRTRLPDRQASGWSLIGTVTAGRPAPGSAFRLIIGDLHGGHAPAERRHHADDTELGWWSSTPRCRRPRHDADEPPIETPPIVTTSAS